MPFTSFFNTQEFKVRLITLVVLYKCILIYLLLSTGGSQSMICGPFHRESERLNYFPNNTMSLFTLFTLLIFALMQKVLLLTLA